MTSKESRSESGIAMSSPDLLSIRWRIGESNPDLCGAIAALYQLS